MTYYRYRQNNSGGGFEGPAIEVFVEADSEDEADEIAQEHGIYFDPLYLIDCECCGNRWSEAWDSYEQIPPEYYSELDELLYGNCVRRLVINRENK